MPWIRGVRVAVHAIKVIKRRLSCRSLRIIRGRSCSRPEVMLKRLRSAIGLVVIRLVELKTREGLVAVFLEVETACFGAWDLCWC